MNLLYRSLITSAAALCASTASADILMQIVCSDCRNTDHPTDFGNFALNQMYGPESWTLQDEVIIYNLQGGWVYVDLSFELQENIITNFADFIGFDLGIPTGRIKIETLSDATVNHTYWVDLNVIDTTGPLGVGEPPPPSPPTPGTGGGGDSSGGGSTGGGGVGAGGGGTGSTGGSGGGGGGNACTSAGGGEWVCVPY